MWKKLIRLAVVVFCLGCALFWQWGLFTPHQDHMNEYQALLIHIDPSATAEVVPYSAKQQREHVVKEIWSFKNNTPLKMSLRSARSELVLDHHDEITEVVEYMQHVECCLQEERQDDGQDQIIDHMDAESATYHYQQEKLAAKKVRISRSIKTGKPGIENPTVLIQANDADYDGKRVVLNGEVVVEHALGTLTGDQIFISPAGHWNSITVQGNVKIALKDGSSLTCNRAEVDSISLQGLLHGDIQKQEQVVYTALRQTPSASPIPFSVKANQMNIRLAKNNGKQSLEHLKASGEVAICYNNDYTATGDHASVDCSKDVQEASEAAKGSPEIISLYGDGQNRACQVLNQNGDTISANSIRIDTKKRTLHFTNPEGILILVRTPTLSEKVFFSGDSLLWEDTKNLLKLRGNAVINQEGFGQLTSDKEVLFSQYIVDKKKRLKGIESSGKTVILFHDDAEGLSHKLNCYGKVFVDHQKLQTIMESPRDSQGNVIAGRQLSFQDTMGDIYADRMAMSYKETDHTLSPSKIKLEGHVRIFNRFSKGSAKSENFLQYALADIVEYAPEAKEVTLSTNEKNRVLFFDKLNNLQVSAPKLTIRRDKITDKESIQGSGNVRFSFVKQEFEEIYKQFGLE